MRQRRQRSLEVRERLPVGGSCVGLSPGLPEVYDRLPPRFSPNRVVGRSFNMLGQPVGIEPLDRCEDLGMKAPPILRKLPYVTS
jgi:hypothetical protein